jgi:oxygen-independent coproporphyrinogen-3 oxidase
MEEYVETLIKEFKVQGLGFKEKLEVRSQKSEVRSQKYISPAGGGLRGWINSKINTLYFGGGTPSLLPVNLLEKILNALYENFEVADDAESTIEANPEQCSLEYLKELKRLGFNRISIGIQSFNDDVLQFLGRTHSGKDTSLAIENARKAGFENISIDLIYGIDLRSLQDWTQELKTAFGLPVKHLSAYSLTVEENTLLHKKISQQKMPNIDEEQSLQEMMMLMNEAEKNGFIHYEVSNFALKDYHSKHNSNYWNGTPYLGFGAAAHSFTGKTRSWNISNVDKYIQAVNENKPYYEMEHLTFDEQYNEYVLLRLRTKEGIDLKRLEDCFGKEKKEYFLESLQKINPQYYKHQFQYVTITKEGLTLLDFITENLLI